MYTSAVNGSTPAYFLSDPLAIEGESVVFDSKGNCYWSFNTQAGNGPGHIVKFKGCAMGSAPVDLGITTSFAGGVAFDSSDDLWYTDQTAGTIAACIGLTSCRVVASGFGDRVELSWNGDEIIYIMDATAGISEINFAASVFKLAAIPGSSAPIGVGAPTMTDLDIKLAH